MKYLIKKILKEDEEQNKLKFYDYVKSKLKPPYFKNLEHYNPERDEIKPILSLIFNQPVKVKDREIFDEMYRKIYDEDSDGYWEKWKYNERNQLIYWESSNGYWEKWEYDKRGNLIYFEKSNGDWEKWEYDER